MHGIRLSDSIRAWPLVLLVMPLPLRPTMAQGSRVRLSSSILASATVVRDRVGVAALRRLEVASNRRTTPITIQPTDPQAGEWQLVGTTDALVQVKLSLPAELVNHRIPAAALPIAFPPTAGRWRREVNDARGGPTFDPRLGTRAQFGHGPDPTLYVWLGAVVHASEETAAGMYRGTVTLTVFYD